MKTGAIIVAAGMSSRMGDFKPMLNIGSISIAQRIVATFHQARISRVVMITGYQADLLEHHLANLGLVFLRNPDYSTTQMFDSVKIGLEYLQKKCSRVLFTPVDIPLFTLKTVETLLDSKAALACPTCDGETGHPILISTSLIPKILSYTGTEGLRGALLNCHTPITRIPVADKGILHDADTPADYQALLKYHNEQLVRPIVKVSLAKESPFFDYRLSMLLSLIEETHSVRTACQRMQISYSTGWNMIRKLEHQLLRHLVQRNQGGAGGGKSYLTPYGKKFLQQYEAFAHHLRKDADELFTEYFKEVL